MWVTKHTPGPWHIFERCGEADVPEGCQIAIDDRFGSDGGRDYYLATVCHGDPDELLANAHLVAASPQLLAACRAAFKLLAGVAFVAKDGDTEKPLRMLRAAIDRAEGRA